MSLLGAGLIALGLMLALAACLLWRRSRGEWAALGLPEGRVVLADTGSWRTCPWPLCSARYRLAGKPDYLMQVRRALLPVEVKPGRTATRPYASDVLQLGAYLLLVEEKTGHRPSHGLLAYRERSFEIPYTAQLRASVLRSLEEMRRLRHARHVGPQHREPQRCRACGQREHCHEEIGWHS